MKHLGDITQIRNPPFVDCITFGSPCQDLSVAGRRQGLQGARSGLFMEAVRIIREMRDSSENLYPTFAIWENVPGAFSSNNGDDFRTVLEELVRIAQPDVTIPRPDKRWGKSGYVAGDGYSLAWRTMDAQYWGVPQRRRRIALVADFGGERAGEILFERESVSGHSEQSIPTWESVAQSPARRFAGYGCVVGSSGFNGYKSITGSIQYQNEIAATLEANMPSNIVHTVYPDIARTLTARSDGSPCADKGPNVVCLQGNMIDREARHNGSGISESETMFTLNATDLHGICCGAFTAGAGAKANGIGYSEEQAPTLRSSGGLNAMPTVIMGGNGNVAHTLLAKSNCVLRTDMETYVIKKHFRTATVRRLTPTECERLQGYPDGWTDIGDWQDSQGRRHKAADSPRYKALGNSIALPQWWWLICKMAPYLPNRPTLGSLFDGIGGFPLVWETRYGPGTAIWGSEIEPFAVSVTKRHFPEYND